MALNNVDVPVPGAQTGELEIIQDFKGRYPKQLWYLFLSEMWERFCFYGMRGMLTYFMITQLSMNDKQANLQYGATQAFVYAFTFVGGLFADKVLGFRKSLFWGGFLMIVGSAVLAWNPHGLFFLGIAITIIGTGFFKPNISSMVGFLYKDNDERRDAGFSLFYSGINIGAFIGGYACIAIAKNYSWHLAFGLAGIVMTISLLTFVYTRRFLGPIGLTPLKVVNGVARPTPMWQQLAVYAGTLVAIPLIMKMVALPKYTDLFMYIVGPATLVYIVWEMARMDKGARNKLIAAMVFTIFSIMFWAFFEQAGGSLSIFAAKNLSNNFLGLRLDPNGVNNSANSLFVIIFAPIIGMLWLYLAKRKREPGTVAKFGLGFILLGLGFVVIYTTRYFANSLGIASLEVFVFSQLVVSLGELCLSPIGLSIITKLSPARLQGVMMGMWFLASAYGQYAAGLLGADMVDEGKTTLLHRLMTYTAGYRQLGLVAIVLGVVLIVLIPWMRRLMAEVK